MKSSSRRYDGIAISLHWIIALLIIGLLIMGKYMTGLEESDALRYTLTQWHKSFGITVLLLIAIRMVWRFTHRPPDLPEHMRGWEILAANLTHVGLYLLMLSIPLSGWIMVSASPLDLPTLLFNKIPWPHLSPFVGLDNKAEISELFVSIHDIAGLVLILLLLAHVGAALRHRLVLHDEVLDRMVPKSPNGRWMSGVLPVTLATAVILAGLVAYGNSGGNSEPLVAGNSRVDFTFVVQNNKSKGIFPESTVELTINRDNPSASKLKATVNTTTATANNSQVDSTLRGSDWFDVQNHPMAIFESSELLPADENNYSVTGALTIREISRELKFPLTIVSREDKRFASGGFTLDRRDFGLGKNSQPDDKTVGFEVEITFEFEVK